MYHAPSLCYGRVRAHVRVSVFCLCRTTGVSVRLCLGICLAAGAPAGPLVRSFVRLTNYMVVCTQSASVQPAAATAIVVIGGYYGGSDLSSGERYDPAADAWSPIASMGTARDAPAAAVIDGLLYAIGGYDGSSTLSSGERYDPAANAWSPIASMSTFRFFPAAVAL